MAELSVADSSAGPLMIRMRAASLVAGSCGAAVWAEKIRMLTANAIADVRNSLVIRKNPREEIVQLMSPAPSAGDIGGAVLFRPTDHCERGRSEEKSLDYCASFEL